MRCNNGLNQSKWSLVVDSPMERILVSVPAKVGLLRGVSDSFRTHKKLIKRVN